MARSSGRQQIIPALSTTIIIETASSSSQQQPQITDSLVLKLRRPKKSVSWKEGTVDNEFMNKKSSKKCCIFHKEKPFDDDDDDDDDSDHDHDHDGRKNEENNKQSHDAKGNCCHEEA
ncbi:hypothetical protein ABFS82_14G319200 [Erythranthe guttata]|uniref:type 1 phosphatases regulator ypi1-like n=1 Tax=Erythranthe guttata TaxID=4155 RepID=UPI00064DF17F|nr:PREDICTED: type 1 phosphatases regulator ypi1-like [Erythranthe guttata]|eukprot:XP_012848303.1 PREDICTED: type 1 phosphatases regulator ypi1-like [Erythranthe guttata]